MPPVTLPHDPVGAAGLDPRVWYGLGLVGVWAAIDAFRERRAPSGTKPEDMAASFLSP